eukprot:SAG11_NODE_340_length_10476_cov_6.009155_5_plen_61_part_00
MSRRPEGGVGGEAARQVGAKERQAQQLAQARAEVVAELAAARRQGWSARCAAHSRERSKD